MYKSLVLMSLGLLTILPNCSQVIPTESQPQNLMNTNLASRSIADLEKAANQQINQYRASKKLPPLSVDSRITQQATLSGGNFLDARY